MEFHLDIIKSPYYFPVFLFHLIKFKTTISNQKSLTISSVYNLEFETSVPAQTMTSKSSNIENFKSLIGMALNNKFSWKALGNLLEEMAPNLSEYKQLVRVLLTELESLHQHSKVVNKPDELVEIRENDIKAFETSCVEDTPICDTQEQDLKVDDFD